MSRTSYAVRLRGGSVAVELGLVAPFLLLLLTVAVDFGMAAYSWTEVQHAAQAGAQYATLKGWSVSGISTAVADAAADAEAISASPAPVLFCGCPTAVGISEVTCSDSCATGTPARQYGRIWASVEHTLLLPYPGLPNPLVLTSYAVVRVN